MKTCKHCKKKVHGGHYCATAHRDISYSDDSSFLTSMAYGAALDNGLLGGVLGGNMAGGLLGEAMRHSMESIGPDPSPSYDSSPSTDSGSSGSDSSYSSSGGDF